MGFSARILRSVRPSSMRRYRALPVTTLVLGAALVVSACTPILLPPPPDSPPQSVPSAAPPTVAVPTTTASTTPSAPATTITTAAPDMTTTPATTTAPPTAAPTTTVPSTTMTTSTTTVTTTPTISTPTSATTTPAAPPSVPLTGDAAVREQILDLVNSERAAAGCPMLVANPQLTAAAQGHADDMAANNYFSHDSLDGSSPFDRIRRAGYTGGGYQAENIARGQRDAAAVMTGWMNSPGHRANILNCVYDDLGVGYTTNGRGPYWVQNFGGVR